MEHGPPSSGTEVAGAVTGGEMGPVRRMDLDRAQSWFNELQLCPG